MSTLAPEERLAVSVPIAARMLGIGPAKTWALISLGELRAIKIGRRTLITRGELERFVAAKEQ